MAEWKFEGKRVTVNVGGRELINGILEAWDPEVKVLVLAEVNDKEEMTGKRAVINWDAVVSFSFLGPVIVQGTPT